MVTSLLIFIVLMLLIVLLCVHRLAGSRRCGVTVLEDWLCLSAAWQGQDDGTSVFVECSTDGDSGGMGSLSSLSQGAHSYQQTVEKTDPTMAQEKVSKHQSGRILVQLVVGICAAALLSGLAVPGMRTVKDSFRERTAKIELTNVQRAVETMMVDQGIGSLSDIGPGDSGELRTVSDSATSDMSVFPYTAAGDYALVGSASGGYLNGDTNGAYYVDSQGRVYQASVSSEQH